MSEEIEAVDEDIKVTEEADADDQIDNYRCKHYRRKCQFVTPCCGDRLYRCRFCHDEEQNHTLRRDDVVQIECSVCGHRQPVQQNCSNCGTLFGKYFCFDCKLYDDEDKQQFHCSGCGICRVGGRSNYFHCDRCDMCLPNHLQGAHKCVERVSRSNCPVCQEDIHTSRIPSQIPPCNHLIHKTCFDEMVSNGHYACPICGVSMMNMTDVWKIYDKEISETPMPSEYQDLYANIQCRDCLKPSLSIFHILGLKCVECGSYNTVRDKGPLVRQPSAAAQNGSDQSMSITPPLSPAPSDQEPSLPSLSSNQSSLEQGSSTVMVPEPIITMTPEPSPMRVDVPGPSERGANISTVARRISFGEEDMSEPT